LLHFEAAMVARYGDNLFHFCAVDNSIGKSTYFRCSLGLYPIISEQFIRLQKVNNF